ncbi:dihydrofolate reductase family protein [Kribbella sp. CA-294648]|uniref:dihydrofolate reductase family protein n=1 Tax=Kribbella sp. CA-294648 TaxID=3239948 RepID=UPI003D8AC754
MRQLIFQEYVTLDGYAAGPNDELDFFDTIADQADDDDLGFLDTVDTMVLGARTYRLFVDYWPTATDVIAPKLNRMRKVVASTTLDSAPWGEWEAGEIVTDAVKAVGELKREDGKEIALWGSITLFHTLLTAGLVDEVQLRVCPLILGAGKSVFPTGVRPVSLELIEAKPWATGGVLLRYKPAAS